MIAQVYIWASKKSSANQTVCGANFSFHIGHVCVERLFAPFEVLF